MKAWLPYPLTSLALFIVWLMINQTLHPAHLVLAALLAIVIPLITRGFQDRPRARIRKPFTLLRLLGMSLVEIVRSCFNVSRVILFVNPEGVRSQFIKVPLDLKDPHGLALLSCLINSTPGTVWIEILPETHELSLHVFDLHDEQWWVDTIKGSYERPLIEVFQGGEKA